MVLVQKPDDDQVDDACRLALADIAVGAPDPQNGIEALAAALLRCDVRRYLTVPGSPATRLAEALSAAGADVLDAHDEKTAVEIAVGMALVGVRAAVIAKGSGGLLLAEALQNAGPHEIGGLLVLLGDDPTATSSTVPTDCRQLGVLVELPVVEPTTGDQVATVVEQALTLSVTGRRPVIVRFTPRLERLRAPDPIGDPRVPGVARTPDRVPLHQRTKLARYLDFADGGQRQVESLVDSWPSIGEPGRADVGIVVAGALWETDVRPALAGRPEPVLALSTVHPLPAAAVEFGRALRQIVVLEEGHPVVETALTGALHRAGSRCRVVGQLTGHVPRLGPTGGEEVLAAIDGRVAPVRPRTWKSPDPLAAGHPYALLFDVLRDIRYDEDVTIHGCVGSCVAAAYPPWQVLDSALSLGASTNVAAGAAAGRGRPAIALIGDYGLVHSGLSGHDQVYQRRRPVLTIVLANGRAVKTGGQPSPVAHDLTDGVPLDLRRLLERVAPPSAVHVERLADHDRASLHERLVGLLRTLPATLVLEDGEGVHRRSAPDVRGVP